jgi:hypothetical protein
MVDPLGKATTPVSVSGPDGTIWSAGQRVDCQINPTAPTIAQIAKPMYNTCDVLTTFLP